MIKILKYFSIIFFILNTNLVKSEEILIAYVNIEKLLSQSSAGKSAAKQLKKIYEVKKKQFIKDENNLKSEEEEIFKQKNVISEEELNNKVKKFQVKLSDYKKQKRNFNNEIDNKRLKATNDLLKTLNKILSTYAAENKISLIIQKKNIIVGKSSLDITEVIMDILNKEIKSINLS